MTFVAVIGMVASFVFAVALTPIVRFLAERVGAVDDPASAPDRKRQTNPVPRFGGLAIIAAVAGALLVGVVSGVLPSVDVPGHALLGLALAGAIIAIGGALDDAKTLSAKGQLLTPILAALAVVLCGVGVQFVANPFGGLLWLDQWSFSVHTWTVPIIGGVLTWIWLMGTTYTTKILDGIDGLVSGIGVIGSVIIYALTLRPEVNQPGIGFLVMAMAGACLGFLLFNWQPASIYLGESGSLFIGFFLGVMAVVSGGKIATALLILGLPIIDLAFVIYYRWRVLKTSPFHAGDRSHLHFRLLDLGLSVRQTVLILYAVTILFGVSTLFVPGKWKVVMLFILTVVTITSARWLVRRTNAMR